MNTFDLIENKFGSQIPPIWNKYTHAFEQLCNKYSHNKKRYLGWVRSKYLSHWCETFIKIYFLSCLRKHFYFSSHLRMMPDNFPKLIEYEKKNSLNLNVYKWENWDWIFFPRLISSCNIDENSSENIFRGKWKYFVCWNVKKKFV